MNLFQKHLSIGKKKSILNRVIVIDIELIHGINPQHFSDQHSTFLQPTYT